jgi:hypothetical protein
MGLFWNLIQQSQISKQQERSRSLEEWVRYLNNELDRQNRILTQLLTILEKHFGQDIDGDGRIG